MQDNIFMLKSYFLGNINLKKKRFCHKIGLSGWDKEGLMHNSNQISEVQNIDLVFYYQDSIEKYTLNNA